MTATPTSKQVPITHNPCALPVRILSHNQSGTPTTRSSRSRLFSWCASCLTTARQTICLLTSSLLLRQFFHLLFHRAYDSNFCFDIWRVTNADYLLTYFDCPTHISAVCSLRSTEDVTVACAHQKYSHVRYVAMQVAVNKCLKCIRAILYAVDCSSSLTHKQSC